MPVDQPNTTPADQVLMWVLSVIVTGVLINLASDLVKTAPLTWGLAGLLSLIVIATAPSGFLRRSRTGGTRGAMIGAVCALLAYLATSVYIATSETEFAVQLAQIGCLWLSATLLSWQSLRKRTLFAASALGVSMLLSGAWMLLLGVTSLLEARLLQGLGLTLGGIAGFFIAIRSLMGGRRSHAIGVMICGIAGGFAGVSFMLDGQELPAMGLGVTSLAAILHGFGAIFNQRTLMWRPLALVGAWFMGLGSLSLLEGNLLMGIASCLLGVGLLLNSVESLKELQLALSSLLTGLAVLLAGVQSLFNDDVLLGAALLLSGFAFFVVAGHLAKVSQPKIGSRIHTYLSHRTDRTS